MNFYKYDSNKNGTGYDCDDGFLLNGLLLRRSDRENDEQEISPLVMYRYMNELIEKDTFKKQKQRRRINWD